MTAADLDSVDPVLKELYVGQKVADVTFKRNPFLAMLPKFTKFGGRNYPVPVTYNKAQGRSAVFATAQANSTANKHVEFLITRVSDYQMALVQAEAAEAAQSDAEAFLEVITDELDGAMETLATAIETFLFRSGTGSIGQISSGSNVGTDTITLEDINEIVNFESGMTLKASATDGGAVRTGSEVVEAVDRNLGTLTATSATWDTVITAIAASDYLSAEGDGANAGANVKISGLAAWVPSAAPSSTAFFGVDRTPDNRLSGIRSDGTSDTVEEALIDLQSKIARDSGRPDTGLINNIQMRRFKKELGTKIEYSRMESKTSSGSYGKVSFRGVSLEGDNAVIDVYACPKCPAGVAYLLELETWKFLSLGEHVRWSNLDGLKILRKNDDDAFEGRALFRGNLMCNSPGYNGRTTLSVPS